MKLQITFTPERYRKIGFSAHRITRGYFLPPAAIFFSSQLFKSQKKNEDKAGKKPQRKRKIILRTETCIYKRNLQKKIPFIIIFPLRVTRVRFCASPCAAL